MTSEPEIQDTPADRAAMAILLPYSVPDPGPIWNEVDVSLLDAAWLALARDLVNAPEARIDAILAAIEAARTGPGDSNIRKLGAERAGDLMNTVLDFRHRQWMNRELQEGREPNRLAGPEDDD